MGKFTVYDLLELFGKVVFGDESRNEVYTWNGDYHFASWRPDEEGFFHNIDSWKSSYIPYSVRAAAEICRDRVLLESQSPVEYNGGEPQKNPDTRGII